MMGEVPRLTQWATRQAMAWLESMPSDDVGTLIEGAINDAVRAGDEQGATDLLVLLARFDQERADALSERTLATVAAMRTRRVLLDIVAERARQDAKWGDQSHHPDGTGFDQATDVADRWRAECDRAAAAGTVSWALILGEEVAEAMAETDPARLRTELIQVAAVATAWAEALDRRP